MSTGRRLSQSVLAAQRCLVCSCLHAADIFRTSLPASALSSVSSLCATTGRTYCGRRHAYRTKVSSVELLLSFLCQQSYLLLLIGISSPTHFHSRLKTFLFCKSFPPQPFLFLFLDSLRGFRRLFTVTSEHRPICFLLLVFLFLHFLVVGSVR